MHSRRLKHFFIAVLAGGIAHAAAMTVDLAAEASRPAANDLARATLFAEATGSQPAEVARKVNGAIAEALATAKKQPRIRAQSGGTHTYPVYGKGGRIESWRMRSEITLESQDAAVLSELVGNLQNGLGVAGVNLMPSPETRRQAENEATKDAIAAFRARAAMIAEGFGKPYRIRQLSIGAQELRQPMPRMRAAPMAAEAMTMPVEAGESMLTVNVSGQIEIADQE